MEARLDGDRAVDDLLADTVSLRQTLIGALRELPPRQRAVIVLRYFDDLTETETARALDIGVGTVKSSASRAIARLRELVPTLASEDAP